MNAMLTIQIRVSAAQAKAALKDAEGDLRRLRAAAEGASTGVNTFGSSFLRGASHLQKFGKNLQWTGQQLQYNFTLPIVLAGAAATKFALDNERAMTGVRKVYGDSSMSAQQLNGELKALETSFRLLSDRFGVNQKEVIGIAGAWAQAGVSGVALARATKLTLQAMIIGEMDATQATNGLIAVQATYGMNTKELAKTLAQLNEVENQTAISMSGMIDVITRAGGSARSAGVDVRHLTAMAAALVPRAGSASQAGNALRTMLSRLMAPTKQAAEVMGRMGIDIYSATWQAKNGVQRIEAMSQSFEGLTQSQKDVVSSLVASRWQINRFDILMHDMANALDNNIKTHSIYQRALEATSDSNKNAAGQINYLANYTRELNTYLASSPQRFKIMTTMIQNALSSAIMPMLPALISLLYRIVQLTTWFSNLSPQVQQFTVFALLMLAAVGPIVRYLGAFSTMLGVVASGLGGTAVLLFGNAMASAKYAESIKMENISMLQNIRLMVLRHGILGGTFLLLKKLFMLPFRVLAGGFGILVSGVKAFAFAVADVAGALGPMLARGMVAAVGLIGNAFSALPMLVSNIFLNISVIASAAAQGITYAWVAFSNFMAAIPQAITYAWVAFSNFMATVPGMISSAWVAFSNFMAAIPGMITYAWVAFSNFIAAVPGLISGAWAGFTAFMVSIPEIAASAWAAFTAAASAVPELITAAWAAWPAVLIALIAAALAAVVILFGDKFQDAVQAAANSLKSLPRVVIAVFRVTVDIIKRAALAVYEWLSYINPFAHHSPSLVEQVTKGVDVIAKQFARLNNIGQAFRKAIADLDAFKKAISSFVNQLAAVEEKQNRIAVQWAAGKAGLAAYDQLNNSIRNLSAQLPKVQAQIDDQVKVVGEWEAKLNAADAALKKAEATLDALSDAASAAHDALSDAQAKLSELTSTGISGQRAMSDAIFENEMAQKRLRLEMLKMGGVGFEDTQNELAKLAGSIEQMQANISDLREAGAGSDVLGPLEAQLKAMEDQRKAILSDSPNADPLTKMQAQLEQLQHQGEILELQNSVMFDPLLRQIDQVVNDSKEMDFETLISSIQSQKQAVEQLTAAADAADAAVEAQQKNVDALTSARDKVSEQYDAEKEKLEALKQVYGDIEDQIGDMKSAMSDFASEARQALEDAWRALAEAADAKKAAKDSAGAGAGAGAGLSEGMAQFDAAAAGDFAVPGGEAGLGREAGTIEDFNKQMQDELEKSMRELGGFDLFKPLKDAWKKAWDWIKTQAGTYLSPVLESVKAWWEDHGISLGDVFQGGFDVGALLAPIGAAVSGWWNNVLDGLRGNDFGRGLIEAFKIIGGFISEIAKDTGPVFTAVFKGVSKVVSAVVEEFKKFGPTVDKAKEAFGHIVTAVLTVIKVVSAAVVSVATVVIGIFSGVAAVVWKFLSPIVTNVIGPIFDAIIGVVKSALDIIRGVINFVLDVINGDWGKAWGDLVTVVGGILKAIWAVIKGAVGTIWGIMKGIVKGIKALWDWLYDVLVGHSIIPDMVNAIIAVFKFFAGIVGPIFDAIVNAIAWAWESVVKPAFEAWQIIIMDVLVPAILWLWNNVVEPAFEGIGNAVQWTWENVIKPALEGWLTFINDILIPAVKWLWNNVVKPAFEGIGNIVKAAWQNVIKPALEGWKAFITDVLIPIITFLWNNVVNPVFKNISTAIKFAWENVIKPVFNALWSFIRDILIPGFKTLWDKVKESWDGIKNKIETIWKVIKVIFQNIVDFVKDPLGKSFTDVKDTIVKAWETIRDKAKSIWNTVGENIKSGVNLAIKAINALIKGLNAVSDILPGIDFTIPLIPELAAGGVVVGGQHNPPQYASGTDRINPTATRVGSGMVTNRPRAIVGEGSPLHPEFVIPTDPQYRSRALGLFNSLGSHLGIGQGGVPMMAWGGIIPTPGEIVDGVKSAGSAAVGALREGVVTATFQPFLTAADVLINQIPWDIPKSAAEYAKNEIYNWVKGTNDGVDKTVQEMQAAALTPSADGINPEFLNRFNLYNAALGNKFTIVSGFRTYAQQVALYQKYLNGTGNLAAKPGTSNHEKGLAIDHSPSSTASDRTIASGFKLHYPVPGEPWHVEPFAKGGILPLLQAAMSQVGGRALNRGVFAGLAMGSPGSIFNQAVDASLANGGRIVHRPGGALLHVAEGRHDEGVQVLPLRNGDNGGSGGNHFYGDLVFPNVKNGNDAEAFVRNLENMLG